MSATAREARAGRGAATEKRGLQVDFQRRVRDWSPPRAELEHWASAALGRRPTEFSARAYLAAKRRMRTRS